MSFFQIVFVPMVVVLMLLFFGFVYHKIIFLPRRIKRETDKLAREAFNTEMARIKELPKLKTQRLMLVPVGYMCKNPVRRSYGTRYNRVLIIDEHGLGWVGLIIPELIESLIAGEYVWWDYHIPFRGAGEAYAGKPVDMFLLEGLVQVDIYPLWMEGGVNISDWALWAQIEQNFRNCSKSGWNYQSGLADLNKQAEEFRKKRVEFNKLAQAIENVK